MSFRYAAGFIKPGFSALAASIDDGIYYNLLAWGRNADGQLGLGNRTNYSSPKQVGSLGVWNDVSIALHCAAIKLDGTLWTWGNNVNGALGLGNITYYSSPKQVGALTNWSKVSTGGSNTCVAIKTDGTLWAWGANSFGQLGLGNRTKYSSPKQVGSLTNWSDVANADNWCAAIKTDGTLWTWGKETYGNLGHGNSTYYSSPKQVGSLTTWSKISKNPEGTQVIAVTTSGTLYAWGRNQHGQLGLGNRTYYSSPKQIGALTTWAYPGGSEKSTICVKTDGTLWTWGYNEQGQLGLGNVTHYSSPKQVGALTNWLKVSGGSYSHASLKTDGTLWTWGWNATGQLGLGDTTNRSSPVQVGSLTKWITIVKGVGSFMAIGK
jgi:alpha-tubulin suppressor-like RCC1 family protein